MDPWLRHQVRLSVLMVVGVVGLIVGLYRFKEYRRKEDTRVQVARENPVRATQPSVKRPTGKITRFNGVVYGTVYNDLGTGPAQTWLMGYQVVGGQRMVAPRNRTSAVEVYPGAKGFLQLPLDPAVQGYWLLMSGPKAAKGFDARGVPFDPILLDDLPIGGAP